MPVNALDPREGSRDYALTLQAWCGDPPILDLAHLGLGADGHSASLIPGDPVLDVLDRDVALTGVYQNHRRMTLTFSLINRSRMILWLATGAAKVPMIQRLLDRDQDIPAGRINQDRAILLADRSAVLTVAGQE